MKEIPMQDFQLCIIENLLDQNQTQSALQQLYGYAKNLSQELNSTASPLKVTMGYNEHINISFANHTFTLSKEEHGNTTHYTARYLEHRATTDELRRLCRLLHEASRRSGERADTERNQSQEKRNQLAESTERTDRSRAEIREDKRRVVLTLTRDSFECPEQREKLILFLKNNNLLQGLLLDIQDEQTHNNECLDSFCSLLEQKGILSYDSQSQKHTTNIHLWNTLLDNQLERTYSPKSVRRYRRHNREEEK